MSRVQVSCPAPYKSLGPRYLPKGGTGGLPFPEARSSRRSSKSCGLHRDQGPRGSSPGPLIPWIWHGARTSGRSCDGEEDLLPDHRSPQALLRRRVARQRDREDGDDESLGLFDEELATVVSQPRNSHMGCPRRPVIRREARKFVVVQRNDSEFSRGSGAGDAHRGPHAREGDPVRRDDPERRRPVTGGGR